MGSNTAAFDNRHRVTTYNNKNNAHTVQFEGIDYG